jgi:hypothetical protein
VVADGTLSEVVTVDRRTSKERRQKPRRTQSIPAPKDRRAVQERRKVPRRRQIDPTTCERDYTDDEIEFMKALDRYKRENGRQFPTCSEILEVIRALGYEKER